MSEEMKLSQAEIDALLGAKPSVPTKQDLTDADRDALGELGNISFGSAATSLSMLLQQRVEITTPVVTVVHPEDIPNDFPRPYVLVNVGYTSGLSGSNALAVELDDAKTIADLMLGGDGRNTSVELNELHLSAVAEAMNQMMGGAATALSTMFGRPINISPPSVKFVDMSTGDHAELGLTTPIVSTSFRLRVGDLIDSKLMQLVPVSLAEEVLRLLRGEMETAAAAVAPAPPRAESPRAEVPKDASLSMAQGVPATLPSTVSRSHSQEPQTRTVVPTQSAVAQHGPVGGGYSSAAVQAAMPPVNAPSIQKPAFVDFTEPEPLHYAAPKNLSLLFDVNLNVTVELGRTKRSIREILDLARGSIVELDKLAGEPVDILVNNKRVAIGEVVVIDENFGVRVTDIISPVERVKNLQ